MKIKIRELLAANEAINNIIQEKMKATIAFKFRAILAAFNTSVDTFNKTREDLLAKYDVKDIEKLELKDRDKLELEFQELLGSTIDINIDKLNVEDFDDIKIAPIDLDALFWLINM